MADPIIRVQNLRVIYNQGKSNEVRSLEDVSVKIFPNEFVIIYGPSGCGKSTLLYAISGLQAPTYGEVEIEGHSLSKMSKKDKVKLHQTGIGMIFQAFYLISSINIIDNVCLPKVFCGGEREERKKSGIQLLRRFNIVEQVDKFPSQLSGGQKQRVAIARSLINNPSIILADEPVGNLDSESAVNVLRILKELNEIDKKTVIMVTHNPEHLFYADRIIHMKDGKIISEEINREKRPISAIKEEVSTQPEKISDELRLLMRTFKNLTPQQMGSLLVPFKAKQLLFHITSELMEEQMSTAENFLKEFLFNNIDSQTLKNKLDTRFEEGGANWNRQRVDSFTGRVNEILAQVENTKKETEESINDFSDYLIKNFKIKIEGEAKRKFKEFIKMRVQNKIDRFGLQQRLDTPQSIGGVGLYKNTVEKVVREVEIIMLLNYSG
jgi:putative ABC transport system ATP-binding protein